ncbi:Prolyl 4-hydroxylase subunit alpha-3 [Chelonia mydas]|uniref:procollagen-proline 4-dioxygenase n=1 Tax=Chelonia mydas TaxID=8469 RepID=M7AGA8_CHEMY|nr:Prolyl 4-hydroxylase subunit alpha-3 [Chelonia mydas]
MGLAIATADMPMEKTKFYNKVQDLHQGAGGSAANPLLAYTLIKRLQSDWLNVVHSLEASENTQALKNGYTQVEKDLPEFEDLEGAARALMRLQDVYALSVKGLVKGVFQRASGTHLPDIYSPGQLFPLSADDCFLVGKVAYDMEDYYHSIAWLEEAVSLFRVSYGEWNTEDEGSLEDALDHLAFSYFKASPWDQPSPAWQGCVPDLTELETRAAGSKSLSCCFCWAGNVSHALSLSREFLHYDPSNKRIARNVLKYERLLVESPERTTAEVGLQRPNVTHLQTRDLYEELCQTLGSQPTQYQIPALHCSYETNDSPYLILQPVKRELIRLQPYVALYHDFVSDLEAEKIKGLAAPWLQRSVVASEEKQQKAEYRISKSAWLKDTVDPVIVSLDQRIAALTGLNIRPPYAEYLQVVNYGIGGHYEPHFDHATLSSVEAGGSTAFIYANLSVPVVKNAALFWWNLHRNGAGNGDTLHAGCPVLAGDKWVANKWIHEHGQEFRRQCGPDPND